MAPAVALRTERCEREWVMCTDAERGRWLLLRARPVGPDGACRSGDLLPSPEPSVSISASLMEVPMSGTGVATRACRRCSLLLGCSDGLSCSTCTGALEVSGASLPNPSAVGGADLCIVDLDGSPSRRPGNCAFTSGLPGKLAMRTCTHNTMYVAGLRLHSPSRRRMPTQSKLPELRARRVHRWMMPRLRGHGHVVQGRCRANTGEGRRDRSQGHGKPVFAHLILQEVLTARAKLVVLRGVGLVSVLA